MASVKYTPEQLAALETLKAAVREFDKAIWAFNEAQPKCGYGGARWVESNWDTIFEIEAEIEDEEDEE